MAGAARRPAASKAADLQFTVLTLHAWGRAVTSPAATASTASPLLQSRRQLGTVSNGQRHQEQPGIYSHLSVDKAKWLQFGLRAKELILYPLLLSRRRRSGHSAGSLALGLVAGSHLPILCPAYTDIGCRRHSAKVTSVYGKQEAERQARMQSTLEAGKAAREARQRSLAQAPSVTEAEPGAVSMEVDAAVPQR